MELILKGFHFNMFSFNLFIRIWMKYLNSLEGSSKSYHTWDKIGPAFPDHKACLFIMSYINIL